MRRDDFERQVRTYLRQRPFRPFRIVLSSGTQLEVDIPEALAFNGGAAGHLDAGGHPFLFQCEDVAQIETHAPEPAA